MNRHTLQNAHFLYPLLTGVFLIVGLILATLVLQYWMILLALAAGWSVTILFMTRLLFDKVFNLTSQERSFPARTRRLPVRFPETPMPATPLIRVLETIDLSRTNMASFIDDTGEAQSTQTTSVQEKNQYTNHTDIHQES